MADLFIMENNFHLTTYSGKKTPIRTKNLFILEKKSPQYLQ